jgi:hypothetical protein
MGQVSEALDAGGGSLGAAARRGRAHGRRAGRVVQRGTVHGVPGAGAGTGSERGGEWFYLCFARTDLSVGLPGSR